MKHLLSNIWNETRLIVALWIYVLMFMAFTGILFMIYQTIFNGVTINF